MIEETEVGIAPLISRSEPDLARDRESVVKTEKDALRGVPGGVAAAPDDSADGSGSVFGGMLPAEILLFGERVLCSDAIIDSLPVRICIEVICDLRQFGCR